MITNVWLKSQPNKKIAYPGCFPLLNQTDLGNQIQRVRLVKDDLYSEQVEALYLISEISRIEFRP